MGYHKTHQIAEAVGVHPNTVRLYEQWGLLMPVERNGKGYRLYTAAHLEQMKLARIALRCDFSAGGIRQRALEVVRKAASGEYAKALGEACRYLEHIRGEKLRAKEVLALLAPEKPSFPADGRTLRRKEAARAVGVTIDVLRNWEMNGLMESPQRSSAGYRLYGQAELWRMKIIYALRSANYSMVAALRMLHEMDAGSQEGCLTQNQERDEDIRHATDRWLSTLEETEKDALDVLLQLKSMHESGCL